VNKNGDEKFVLYSRKSDYSFSRSKEHHRGMENREKMKTIAQFANMHQKKYISSDRFYLENISCSKHFAKHLIAYPSGEINNAH